MQGRASFDTGDNSPRHGADSRAVSEMGKVRPGSVGGTALVLLTCDPGDGLAAWLTSLGSQTIKPDRLLLIDSSSDDGTVGKARAAGFEVVIIAREDFSHGGTRQAAVEMIPDADVIIFLTQDAVLVHPKSLELLIERFADPKVGAAYGRQLPRPGAGPIEAHARLFNYPSRSAVRDAQDIPRLGIKTSFISNSFAAWRRAALLEVKGFPSHTIQNEDTYVASKMILGGWKVAYVAEATVYHSHRHGYREEFRRYFDIGVFHARDPWIRRAFGNAEGEGFRYVRSELKYVGKRRRWAIAPALLRTGLKLAGYKLGNFEAYLPGWAKGYLSKNEQYWRKGARRG